MADQTQKLAEKIHASLKENPNLTVDELAGEHDSDHATVVSIIDSYRVVDGKPKQMEPGQGGGWLDSADAA